MKKILYVGNFSFPHGNASGSRVLGNGYLFKELGYEVIYVGLDDSLSQSSILEKTKQFYGNFVYYNLSYPIGIRGWLSYKKRYKQVISLIIKEKISITIGYGSPSVSIFCNLIRIWCKKNGILYFSDCVDWLSISSGTFAYRVIKFMDDNYQKRVVNAKADGVITISSYLSNYYSNRNCKTVTIPPLINPDRYNHLYIAKNDRRKDDPLRLIYIGMPFATDGRSVKENSYKDRLDIAIEALYKIKDLNFIFNIYGITKAQYLSVIVKHLDILEQMKEKVIFRGKISNHIAITKIAESDFTILLRDVNKMTTAGFPTKFVETISCGTPIITTNTSDLQRYIKIGKNGFLVTSTDENILSNQLREIFLINRSQIDDMKRYCKESKLFSYSNYADEMQDFLGSF